METIVAQIIDTWQIHNRIGLYLLDAIDEAHYNDIPTSKGRSVGSQFAHIHNVRLMWLKVAAPDILATQTKLEKEVPLTRALLKTELDNSAQAIAQLLEKGFQDGKIKGFKPHPAAFVGYCIAHESHHRGQILLALKQSGHPIDQKTQYGLWEWGSR